VDKEALNQMWDQMRQKYGIYLRLIEAIPEDRLHTHPIPDMRTPAQLMTHMSGTVIRDLAQGIAKGEVTADEDAEESVAAGLATRQDALRFARECWDQAQEAVDRIGDAELQAMVLTPWDMTFPGWVGFHIMSDEFVHHRGQLYAFARACGVAPPFIWSHAENAPEFQPVA
jgi:uncharacterized damage-inducible protein DinB